MWMKYYFKFIKAKKNLVFMSTEAKTVKFYANIQDNVGYFTPSHSREYHASVVHNSVTI
jgi:hypothetical protein